LRTGFISLHLEGEQRKLSLESAPWTCPKGCSLVDADVKPGLLREWHDEVKHFGTETPRQELLPHLGTGAGLVTIFVSSFFAAHLADAFAVIVAYGPQAYFREGLHITDWKHGLLSNGAYLSFLGKLIEVPTTLMLLVVAVYAADFCSMLIEQSIRRNGRWMGTAFRLVGGTALLAFAAHLYRQGSWGLHPVPFSALIGGAALVWKALASIARKSIETET